MSRYCKVDRYAIGYRSKVARSLLASEVMALDLNSIRKSLMLDGIYCEMCTRKKTLYTSSYGIEITIAKRGETVMKVEVLEPVSESFVEVYIVLAH